MADAGAIGNDNNRVHPFEGAMSVTDIYRAVLSHLSIEPHNRHDVSFAILRGLGRGICA